MDIVLKDIQLAARRLIRTPGFTIVAVATLALAVGATTAMFSVLDAVLLKPLPFANADEVVHIGSYTRGKPGPMSVIDYNDYRAQSKSFVGMAGIDVGNVNLTATGAQPMRLNRARVGAEFFQLLGVRPQLGRAFTSNEDAQNASPVVVISDALWRGRFGADAGIVGRQISIDSKLYTVVGVAPAGMTFPRKADVWVPFVYETWERDPANRGAHSMFAVGRVKPGVSVDAAAREIRQISRRLEQQYPDSNTGWEGYVRPLREQLVGNVRPALLSMLGAVAFVLLIACANIANLLLVRAADQEADLAVRTALGASRGRIIRQLLTESVLLSLVGAALGALLASTAVRLLVAFGPRNIPRLDEVTVNGRVLLFTASVALVTGLLFGLAPALYAARTQISEMLRRNIRGGSRGGAQRTRNLLVVAEMGLAVVLLVGAGLLIRSFVRLTSVDPGFRTENVVSFNVTLPTLTYPLERDIRQFTQQVTEKLQRVPGAQAVGVTFERPMGNLRMRTSFETEGRPESTPANRSLTNVSPSSAGYFRALNIPLVRGRIFTDDEGLPGRPQVVVVNQEFVRRYFPNEDPIGKRITLGIAHDTAEVGTAVTAGGEIIGIVGDTKQSDLATETVTLTYMPWNAMPITDATFVVRTSADPRLVMGAVRSIVSEVDADLPIYDLTTMEQVVQESVGQPRFYMMLLAAFAGIALLLAALGIYGVISYAVTQRTRELGIRIAMGASGNRVAALVLRQGLSPTLTGVVLGMAATFWLTRIIASLLFGVSALDPLTLVAVPALLLCVAAAACWLPARRAARVDPIIAIRAD